MSATWETTLQQDVDQFVANASATQIAKLLAEANVDYFNRVGAPLVVAGTSESLLLGSAVLNRPVAAVSQKGSYVENFLPVQDLAGKYEEMPMAA